MIRSDAQDYAVIIGCYTPCGPIPLYASNSKPRNYSSIWVELVGSNSYLRDSFLHIGGPKARERELAKVDANRRA